MNKLTKISAIILAGLTIANAANAATTGTYVGGSLGYSTLEAGDYFGLLTNSGKVTKDTHGLGGKLFAGYNINENFGLELGYARYASATEKLTISGETAKRSNELSAISLVGKAYAPLSNNKFNVYALAGLAEVNSKTRMTAAASKTTHALRPTYGIGASYEVMPQVTANVELSRIQGRGNTNSDSLKAIPNADMLSAGLAYNFG